MGRAVRAWPSNLFLPHALVVESGKTSPWPGWRSGFKSRPSALGADAPMETAMPQVPAPHPMLPCEEHRKGVTLIEDELYSAQAALMAGQVDRYKAKLQSAFVSLQVLLRQEVA